MLAGCPLSTAGLRHLADHLTRSIAALLLPPAKVVVLDLDNTLWGGIVGEDGPGGIAIGPSGLGAAFAAFQDALLALRAQGGGRNGTQALINALATLSAVDWQR